MAMSKPIFFDPTGRRGRTVTGFAWAVGALSLITLAGFITTLVVVDGPAQGHGTNAPPLCLNGSSCRSGHGLTVTTVDPTLLKSARELAAQLRESERTLPQAHPFAGTPERRAVNAALVSPPGRALSIGFYVNEGDNSYPSLKRSLSSLDWVVPNWLGLRGPGLELTSDIDDRALSYIRATKPETPILPMIQNAANGKWNGEGLAALLGNPAARTRLVGEIKTFLDTNKFQGVTIDFEELPPAAQPNLKLFLQEMSEAFADANYAIVLSVPFDDDAWDYESYASIADFMLLMGYDEHWDDGEPGSIAGQGWFEKTLDKRMRTLDPRRTIIAIGGYGYDWVKGMPTAELTFQEAVLSAKDSEADIIFDSATSNPHFSFIEDDGKRHDVWFLDGVTAFNEIRAADSYRPAGYALWRLGSEDPSIWSVLGRAYDAPAPAGLNTIGMSEDVDLEGTGGILRVLKDPETGTRRFEIDNRFGQIIDETYTRVPTPYVIGRTGAAPGKLALTFDDGPDRKWTPDILDILKDKNVKASFFVVGSNAEIYPELLQRIMAEGHDIGNHTFTHPNLGELPSQLVRLEINANQRLTEAVTERSMRLFRAPYLGDTDPTTGDEIVPMEIAQSMGFTTVGVNVDPGDWQKRSPDEIIQRVLAQLDEPDRAKGSIVLLHDSGGDRSATVAALPKLIDTLRARGYTLVPVSELAGMTPAEAMPPVSTTSLGFLVDRPVFMTIGWLEHLVATLFLLAIGLGVVHLVFLCGLALRSRVAEAGRVPPELPSSPPLHSVLIPAFNEAMVIEHTVRRILQSDYPNLEVIVIDDGSTDGTSDVVREHFSTESRVRLITVANGGKASALNHGLAAAQGEVIVALDADTHFEHSAISKLVRWFQDPAIGAVAGNAKVGNRINILTRWQALEYVTSQNLERRALASLGCMTVVPGAIGAWRRDALVELGGFPVDTLAEDQDLTIAIQKAGYDVLYDSSAIAWTEAPDTVEGLVKQRFRWAFGTLQCLWKHRDVTFRPRHGALGLVAMPRTWLFQFGLSTIAPIADLLFTWQLFVSVLDVVEHGAQADGVALQEVALYYAIFLVIDLAGAALAFAMERKENLRLLPWLVLQRLGYRQLMYYVILKAGVAALLGPLVGWNKLDRTGTAQKHPSVA
jgi:peptidoglycan-N-acetylglucosamine deacetylase